MTNISVNQPSKKRILTKNVFLLPEDILNVMNKYDPRVLPIFLMFKKLKFDNYVNRHKEDEYRYENLTNWTKKFHNIDFDNFQPENSDLDGAFYNYLEKIKSSLKLPKNITRQIENNKKSIKSAENISNQIMLKIQKVCLHKNTREYKQFIYDECVESTQYCEFCNIEVREL